MNFILIIGGLLGLTGIMFGSYAEHILKTTLSAAKFSLITTALHYQQLHAIIISIIGLFFFTSSASIITKPLLWSGWCFILGTVLFSFSIYLAVLLDARMITKLAPIGGTLLMLGWLLLVWLGFTGKFTP
ncbi:MAG: DUF423 domain-containing protein [Gammaproteobacteria bacterium]